MDIKAKIEEIVKKLMNDKSLMAKFERNPVSVIEELIGIDLPDQQVNQLIEGIRAKIKLDQVGDMLGGIGNLFFCCGKIAVAIVCKSATKNRILISVTGIRAGNNDGFLFTFLPRRLHLEINI